MTYRFNANQDYTLGVELEMQLVDAQSMELSNSVEKILSLVPEKWADSFKPEFMGSYCEINTGVCRTVDDVERDLGEKLNWATEIAHELDLELVWSGTHPFSLWRDQVISPGERYAWLMNTMQHVARRLVCFGLHVHVGVDSGDKAIQMCDRLLRHLPTLLALSSNSPMWCGSDTGLASYRSKLMEALPTAGLPHPMRNWSEYVWLVDHLIETNFIHSIREMWWDVRPHAGFGTVEIRIMDMPMSLDHTLGLVALCQSLVAAISENINRGAYLYDCHPMIAKQNKWHAARWGMDATFVDPDTMRAVPAPDMARMLIDRCSEQATELGCRDHLDRIHDIIDHGTGAQRQREVFRKTNDSREVVRYLVNHTAEDRSARQPAGEVEN
ncbi:MAG: YbdK family carboxylate-amine ligase [Phycisphaerales bacterium]|nr:MAG: YbdK family carboxylate-amine ligase [Phycisphaerales bacterium]